MDINKYLLFSVIFLLIPVSFFSQKSIKSEFIDTGGKLQIDTDNSIYEIINPDVICNSYANSLANNKSITKTQIKPIPKENQQPISNNRNKIADNKMPEALKPTNK